MRTKKIRHKPDLLQYFHTPVMSILFTILFLLISITSTGKSKPLYIEINTGFHAKQNKKLRIFHSRKEIERVDGRSESFEVNKTNIIIDGYNYDTLILKSEVIFQLLLGDCMHY